MYLAQNVADSMMHPITFNLHQNHWFDLPFWRQIDENKFFREDILGMILNANRLGSTIRASGDPDVIFFGYEELFRKKKL